MLKLELARVGVELLWDWMVVIYGPPDPKAIPARG